VGVSSQDVESKCWETDLDGAMVQKAVPKLLAEIGKESLPIVALGMAAVLHAFYAALLTAHDHETSQ
jgi:hypothetical protein